MKKQCSVQDSYGVGKSMEKSLGHSPAWKNFLGHFGTRVDSGIFGKKAPKRTWLFSGISPLLYGLRTWSKRQKTREVFLSALEKKFLLGGCVFFVSDDISGGLLGHLGPLCLALGANR